MDSPIKLAVADCKENHSRATELAQHLQLPLCRDTSDDDIPLCSEYDFYLFYTNSEDYSQAHLSLACPGGDLGSPFFIDFAHGQLAHRRQYGGGRGQALARAIGLKGGANPTVVDATAGMGRDAFVLACLGATVALLERSAILTALLNNGLQRAAADPELDAAIPARMKLIEANAIEWLTHCPANQRPDVVYLDPMYPHRSKSALIKKEMRILRALVGDDDDADQLLEAALACAKKRVVVKRPKGAPSIIPTSAQGLRPASAVESKNTRYDIYPVPQEF